MFKLFNKPKYPQFNIPDQFVKSGTDGASYPRVIRWLITKLHGQKTMEILDEGGVLHDWLQENKPQDFEQNRKVFISYIRSIRYFNDGKESKIPRWIYASTNVALHIFDRLPQWLQKLLKKTT